mgnify:CR=1 FL=1
MSASVAADLLAGVGSLIAVGVALWYSQLHRRDLNHERLLSIHVWAERLSGSSGEWKLIIENGTSRPIYLWECRLSWDHVDEGGGLTSSEDRVDSTDLGIIPPGHHEYSWLPSPAPAGEHAVFPSLEFQDSRGRTWIRSVQGEVKRVRKMHGGLRK